MQIGLYIAVSLLVTFVAFEFALRMLDRLGVPATVSECWRYIRVFIRAGYPGMKLYFKHQETGREIKLKKIRSTFRFRVEVLIELTVVVPPSGRPDQVDRIWGILKEYELGAEVIRPGELFAICPVDEELLSGLVRSIFSEGFDLSFGAQLRVFQLGPLSVRELIECDKQ